MLGKIVRIFISIIGGVLGYTVINILQSFKIINLTSIGWMGIAIHLGTILIFGIIFYILSPRIIRKLKKLVGFVENELQKIPASDIVLGTIGLIIGLVIAFLISQPFDNFGGAIIGTAIQVIIFISFGYLGVRTATRKRTDVERIVRKISSKWESTDKKDIGEKVSTGGVSKILDTSVIIDGRIADICKSGFMEGPLVIPKFVLKELQNIADSADDLKRQRGRRGLDILNKIQKDLDIEVIVHEEQFENIKEVDSKLLELAKLIDGKLVTNDYNLNKVAKVQDIEVLNINELANAVKPVVLPGENMQVEVIKDGKESGQGVAYLDDGTMIVVESGKKYIGKTIDVTVTSVLQTSAGKMIFGKPKTLVNN